MAESSYQYKDDTLLVQNPFYPSPVFQSCMMSTDRVLCHQGGTWSGKTFSILQALILLTISTKYFDNDGNPENIVTTIVGQDVPNLTKGAIRDFGNVIERLIDSLPEKERSTFAHTYNSTKKIATFRNGAKLEFSSFKNWQDAKSGKRHFLFINEANGIQFKVYEQLQQRVKIRTFIDFNADSPFWVHHKLVGKIGVRVLYSNFTHNKYIPAELVREFKAKGRTNPEWWDVYGLGKTGQVEGVIFPNVNWVYDLPEKFKKESYGLDFGFTNDPSTLVQTRLGEHGLYSKCLMYGKGFTSSDIAERMDGLNINKKVKIYADSSAPQTIEEIRRLGYKNIIGAKKPKGSIKSGIDALLNYQLHIVDNIHWRSEQLSYKWKTDKQTGLLLKEPIDDFNHLWDSFRYSYQGIKRTRSKVNYR